MHLKRQGEEEKEEEMEFLIYIVSDVVFFDTFLKISVHSRQSREKGKHIDRFQAARVQSQQERCRKGKVLACL